MKIRLLAFSLMISACFGSLEVSTETMNGREALVHTRDDKVISRTFLNSDGVPIIQHLYFEGTEAFVIANNPAVDNVYHKSLGIEGVEILEFEADSRKQIMIGRPAENKLEVFVFNDDGFVDPVRDEELKNYGYIDLGGNCLGMNDEK